MAEIESTGSVPRVVVRTAAPLGGGGGTTDHRALTARDAPDQHPTSSVTGLDAALADRPVSSEVARIAEGEVIAHEARDQAHSIDQITGLPEALAGKEGTGTAAAEVADHVAEPDPHPQYTTGAEASDIATGAVAAHAAKAGAHPISGVSGLQTALDDRLLPAEVIAGANVTVDRTTTPGSVIISAAGGGGGWLEVATWSALPATGEPGQIAHIADGIGTLLAMWVPYIGWHVHPLSDSGWRNLTPTPEMYEVSPNGNTIGFQIRRQGDITTIVMDRVTNLTSNTAAGIQPITVPQPPEWGPKRFAVNGSMGVMDIGIIALNAASGSTYDRVSWKYSTNELCVYKRQQNIGMFSFSSNDSWPTALPN